MSNSTELLSPEYRAFCSRIDGEIRRAKPQTRDITIATRKLVGNKFVDERKIVSALIFGNLAVRPVPDCPSYCIVSHVLSGTMLNSFPTAEAKRIAYVLDRYVGMNYTAEELAVAMKRRSYGYLGNEVMLLHERAVRVMKAISAHTVPNMADLGGVQK